MHAPSFRQPWIVYLLSFGFLLAPFGNLALSLRAAQVEGWYAPSVWMTSWGTMVQAPDRAFLIATFVAGLLLLWPRKLPWALALGVLGVALLLTLGRWINGDSPASLAWPCLVSGVGMALVLFHFRYPYLDRRETLTSRNTRVRPTESLQAFSGPHALGPVLDLSLAGFRVDWQASKLPRPGEVFEVSFGSELTLHAQVRRVVESEVGFKVLSRTAPAERAKFHRLYRSGRKRKQVKLA